MSLKFRSPDFNLQYEKAKYKGCNVDHYQWSLKVNVVNHTKTVIICIRYKTYVALGGVR